MLEKDLAKTATHIKLLSVHYTINNVHVYMSVAVRFHIHWSNVAIFTILRFLLAYYFTFMMIPNIELIYQTYSA